MMGGGEAQQLLGPGTAGPVEKVNRISGLKVRVFMNYLNPNFNGTSRISQ